MERDDLVQFARGYEYSFFLTLTSSSDAGITPASAVRATEGLARNFLLAAGVADHGWRFIGNCEPHADGRLHAHALLAVCPSALVLQPGTGTVSTRSLAVRKHRVERLVVKRQKKDRKTVWRARDKQRMLVAHRWCDDRLRGCRHNHLDFTWWTQYYGWMYYWSRFQSEHLRSNSKAAFYVMKTLAYSLKAFDAGRDTWFLGTGSL